MDLMKSVDLATLNPILAEHWPHTPQAPLRRACRRMLGSRTWDTVCIDSAATERWMRILQQEGMIRRAPTFRELIDTSVVDAIAVPAAVTAR
jgi:NitT/TauT family transport system substrate-binding protein